MFRPCKVIIRLALENLKDVLFYILYCDQQRLK